MANPEHVAILKQGVEVWNRWRRETWPDSFHPDLKEAKLNGLDLSEINFGGTELSGASLWETILIRANLSRATLWEAVLVGANLTEANLNNARLRGSNFGGTNLSRANLSEAEISSLGFHLPNANLNQANLCEANLHRARLAKVNLAKANLAKATLEEAELWEANLREADLSKANLSRANLSGALLWKATLDGANLSHADLFRTNFNEANLQGVNFSGAKVRSTNFGDVDLSGVNGLETVDPLGPSVIGGHTLRLSKGKIPAAFLRDCGLSDWEIEAAKLYCSHLSLADFNDITNQLRTLRLNSIQYYSCFISYSSKDESFAQHLHADLQQKGIRCWFAPKDMKIGDKIRPAIDQSIRNHDKLLLVLSENSINSRWVEKEVETAFEEEDKRGETILFPIRLDEAVMETNQSWAADIRRIRHIGDFSRWKDHDSYQEALERLLRDLKAEG